MSKLGQVSCSELIDISDISKLGKYLIHQAYKTYEAYMSVSHMSYTLNPYKISLLNETSKVQMFIPPTIDLYKNKKIK